MNPRQHHTQAEQRRETIAALYVQGQSQSTIAQHLGISQQQVSYDLKAIQKAWLASTLRDFDRIFRLEMRELIDSKRQHRKA